MAKEELLGYLLLVEFIATRKRTLSKKEKSFKLTTLKKRREKINGRLLKKCQHN